MHICAPWHKLSLRVSSAPIPPELSYRNGDVEEKEKD